LEIFYRRDPAGFVDVHSLDGVSTGQLAMVVQPTFLYELLWNLAVFAALIYLDRRFAIGHGRLFALYVAGYCIGRFCIELLRDDAASHIAGIRINSFTSTFVFIGAVVYLILAPKGREDPATLSASAADRLVPDSVDEATTDSSEPDTVVATVVDEPVGEPATTATPAETTGATAGDKPGVEAEAVAAEADGAEVDASKAEAAETPEQAATHEPEPQETVAEEPAGEVEPEEPEEEPAAEAEPEEPEEEPAAEAEPEEPEEEKAGEEPAGEAEPEEAEPEKSDEESAAKAAAVEAEPEAEAAGEVEAAGELEEAAESPDDDAATAKEPMPEADLFDRIAITRRLRELSTRLRRR
jgi:hypothetical protein